LQGAQPVLLIRESSCQHVGSNQHCTTEAPRSHFWVSYVARIGIELRNQGLLNTGCILLLIQKYIKRKTVYFSNFSKKYEFFIECKSLSA
jgi:hypothetical protein